MDPWNKPPKRSPWDKNPPSPNVDEVLNNLQNQLKNSFKQRNAGFLIVIAILIAWLATGFFTVDPQEQAVIQRFGKIHSVVGPGPHYRLPYPIDTAIKEKVTAVRRIEIGFRTIEQGPPARYRQVKKESLMLTGDENIVDVQFTVQYKIIDLISYLFNITEPSETVRAAAESAMRTSIGHTTVDNALTTGKGNIETTTKQLLQEILDSYGAGVHVENVKLQDVHPPVQVQEAFKDVASAKEDREKMINEAEGYRNNLIPKARGEAIQVINDAQAYAEKTVLIAQGKAKRFDSIYEEYKQAKDITRQRISLETMEDILPQVNKVVADPSVGKNFIPFLPIDKLENIGSKK